jgi:hypothetical protein
MINKGKNDPKTKVCPLNEFKNLLYNFYFGYHNYRSIKIIF